MTVVIDNAVATGGITDKNRSSIARKKGNDFAGEASIHVAGDKNGAIVCSVGSLKDIPDFKSIAPDLEPKLGNGGFLFECRNYSKQGNCLLDPFHGATLDLDTSFSGHEPVASDEIATKVIGARNAGNACAPPNSPEASIEGNVSSTTIINRYYYPSSFYPYNPFMPIYWPVTIPIFIHHRYYRPPLLSFNFFPQRRPPMGVPIRPPVPGMRPGIPNIPGRPFPGVPPRPPPGMPPRFSFPLPAIPPFPRPNPVPGAMPRPGAPMIPPIPRPQSQPGHSFQPGFKPISQPSFKPIPRPSAGFSGFGGRAGGSRPSGFSGNRSGGFGSGNHKH